MTPKTLLVAAVLLLSATSASFAQTGPSDYDYAPGVGIGYPGPFNYSGYPSGQPGPSSGIEAYR